MINECIPPVRKPVRRDEPPAPKLDSEHLRDWADAADWDD